MKRLSMFFTLFMSLLLMPQCMKAQRQSLTVFADYTYAKQFDQFHGFNAGVAYNLEILPFFSISPEAALDWRGGHKNFNSGHQWQTDLSLRALASVRIPGQKLNLFTGPVMDVLLFHGNDYRGYSELIGGLDTRHVYNTITAYWQFGLRLDFSKICLRTSYSLPMSNYVHINSHSKLHLFEFGIGYKFAIK